MTDSPKSISPATKVASTTSDQNKTSLDLLDKRQLATELKVTTRTITKWQNLGYLPFIKVGNRCLYQADSVMKALERKFGHNSELF